MTTYTGGTGITVDNTGNVILVDSTVLRTVTNQTINGVKTFNGTVDFTSATVIGNAGYTGSQGNVGFTGSQGFNGSVGFTGSAGFTGSVSTVPGPQGNIGYTGSAGPEGPTGFSGSKGDQGPQGDRGFTGSQGLQGPAGPPGDGQDVEAFRTVRVVDAQGNTTNIIADQSQDVLTFESGANVSLTVVDDDRIVVSTSSPIGFTGSRGYTGSIGFQGSQGDRGLQGSRGPTGFNGSYGYTGSIGFTGSQGVQGVAGPAGNIGYTGSRGADSIVPGYTGSIGLTGPIGFTGSQGGIGNVGYTGSRGLTGSVGYQGSIGFIGFTGSRGVQGFTGSLGQEGPIGYSGSRGNTGYAGSRGFTGSRGVQGIQGNPGIRGYTGSRGNQGIQGETGYTGSKGFAGSTGYTGSKGARGPIGQGIQGFTGSQGVRGFTGSQGGPAEAFRTFRHQNTDTGLTDLIIADQPEDVMTFVSGKGILIDFNEATDTITFAVDDSVVGGGGNAIVDINVVNNDPSDISFIAWDSDTQVLSYTPIDISGLASSNEVVDLFQDSKDYANALVEAEAEAREIADNNIYNYVNENINRLEEDLSSNIIILTNYTDTANVYLQGLIQDEANARASGDFNLQNQIDALSSTAGNILLDLDANVLMLQQEIQDVEANSIARDNQLQINIDAVQDNVDDVADGLAQEILDRIAGDEQLQANIDVVQGNVDDLSDALQSEANARIAGDALLQGQINVLDSGLTAVNGNLAQEIIDRELADEALQNQITLVEGNITVLDNRLDQEILDRIAGDQQLQANLDLEVSIINGELQILANAIQEEANIRANADNALSDRINVEALRNDGQDGEIDDLDIRVTELENRVEFSIDYGADLTELGQPNTQAPDPGEFIPLDTGNNVVNSWADATMLYMNAIDDEGTYHFLDGIRDGDDLVFQHRTLGSYCRYEVTANVILTGDTANIFVSPVASNGVIEPANGSLQTDYIVQFFPNVAGDVPSYEYVDTQDARRVLKAGDTMTGRLTMSDNTGITLGNSAPITTRSDINVNNGDVNVRSGGKVWTNIVSSNYSSDLEFDRGGSPRISLSSNSTDFLLTPARYNTSAANSVGNNDLNLIHKGHLDKVIDDLDLANTYVNKSGDVMSGTLEFNPSTITALKFNPVDGSLQNIDMFDSDNTTVTTVDIRLIGNTSENRFRILGGENTANTMVAWTARGDFVTNVPMDMNNNKITSVGNPTEEQDAANKEYVDGAITQSQADIEDLYVNVAGDTMTGKLTITGGGITVSNRKDVTVEGGDVKVTNSGSVVTNTLNSNGNSNLTLKRNDQDKLSFNLTNTTSYQPIRYNSNLLIRDDLDLVHRAYTENRYLKNSDTSILTGYTTIDATAPDTRLIIKGPATGTGFVIRRSNNLGMFYQEDNDIRLANTTFDSDNSVVSRIKGDQRYGLKGDFVRKSGDTMTGKLTTEALEVTGTFEVNNTNNAIDFKSDAYGKLLYKGTPRLQVAAERAIVNGMLWIEDGLDSSTGLPIDGQINMNNRKIVNLLNPTAAQDAATKYYVDEAVASGGDFVKKSGDIMTGSLEAPELKAKNITPGNMGKLLVEGWVDGTASAAQILMSNKQYNIDGAYGKLTFQATSSSNAYFQFDKNLDMSGMGLHSVARVRLTGDKVLQEGTSIRIKFNNKVEILRPGDNKEGFTIFGQSNSKLLSAYHNGSGTADAINYEGRQQAGSNNLATVKYVEEKIASSGSGSQKTWPGRRFKFTSYGQQSGVPTGYFSPSANSNSTEMFMSVQDLDGIRINQGSPDYTPGVTMTLSLFENASGTWRQKGLGTFGGAETDYRGNYIRLAGFTWKQRPTLAAGATYAIVVSSMWG